MNRVHAMPLRRVNNFVDTQIAFRRRRPSQMRRLIRHLHRQRTPIRVRINRDASNASLAQSAHNAYRDLPPIRHQNFSKHDASFDFSRGDDFYTIFILPARILTRL